MKRRTPTEWQNIVEQQKASGLAIVTFCQQNNINIKSFYNWRAKLGLNEQDEAPTLVKEVAVPAKFVKVKPAKVSVGLPTEITLKTHQAMLQLPATISPQWVGQLLRELNA